jgi:predicted flap endonuclease-1-like 5' DNA nuclease
MNYKIIDIEGIGAVYAEKLKAAGIDTAGQLLEKGATPKGRKELEEATSISGKLILRWVNHADLYRVNGVGPQFAELLEASGVDTVKEFRHRNAANLAAKMQEVNEEKKLTRRVPTEAELQKMIDEATTLPPTVTY